MRITIDAFGAGILCLSLCFYTLLTMNKSSILPTIFLGLAGLGLTLAGIGMAIAGWVQ